MHQDRRFRWLLGARAISEIGDGIALIALILYVKDVEETGMAVGGLLLASCEGLGVCVLWGESEGSRHDEQMKTHE